MNSSIDSGLRPLLSHNASISHSADSAPRWSDFEAPDPGTVVAVAVANDVAETVCSFVKNTFLCNLLRFENLD